MNLENTNIIYSSNQYKKILEEIDFYEKDRIFCKHNIEHFLSVARIMYIISTEKNLNFNPDMIYTTALLHDLGRLDEYKYKADHAISSIKEAEKFLKITNFSDIQKEIIKNAIKNHRGNLKKSENDIYSFVNVFKKADKLSRNCKMCSAKSECYWKEKNENILY
ncbi:MAG: HD domain-containing protein [Peptoniphilaceae bacterium]|nr:HD domain-containing protein [Peptoniphilaceae bacterium]MDD7382975.1 HD domain-containing protein [Peptoniphilaceae bacterium]MDY3737726.1 HD domain-containing protein [Peptoniphilaceae bacterium]